MRSRHLPGLFCGIVSTLLVTAGCTGHAAYMNATLPKGNGPWVAPMVDPLIASHPLVWGKFENKVGSVFKRYEMAAMLDSGASRSVFSKTAAGFLGLETRTSRRIMVSGVSGRARPWQGAVVPRVSLGGSEIVDFPTGLIEGKNLALIGNEILASQDRPF